MTLSSVLFPDPLTPTTASDPPASRRRFTPRSTLRRWPEGSGYSLQTSRSSSSGAPASIVHRPFSVENPYTHPSSHPTTTNPSPTAGEVPIAAPSSNDHTS